MIRENQHDNGSWAVLSFFTFNERKRTVLEGTATKAFGVKIAHFFELESPFVGNRFTEPFSQNKTVMLIFQFLRNSPAFGPGFQRHAYGQWQSQKSFAQFRRFQYFGRTIH